jgi:hypothetical protein
VIQEADRHFHSGTDELRTCPSTQVCSLNDDSVDKYYWTVHVQQSHDAKHPHPHPHPRVMCMCCTTFGELLGSWHNRHLIFDRPTPPPLLHADATMQQQVNSVFALSVLGYISPPGIGGDYMLVHQDIRRILPHLRG